MCWSGLQLPWLELDWFMDVSSRITHLDLSSNSLAALPSVVPWGLVHLESVSLSNNLLKELPVALSSQEVLCSRYMACCSPVRCSSSSGQWAGKTPLSNQQLVTAAATELTVTTCKVAWMGLTGFVMCLPPSAGPFDLIYACFKIRSALWPLSCEPYLTLCGTLT